MGTLWERFEMRICRRGGEWLGNSCGPKVVSVIGMESRIEV